VTALFVTGTDTGVGKTFVACALARALCAAGRRVAVLKPVETGVAGEPEDAFRLRAAADDPAMLDDVCPYRLRAPLAPAVAAAMEGVRIDVERIVALVARRAAAADVLLVEGAGGLLVPVAGRLTWADVAARSGLPLLVVAANRLGTVNHCALTARVAEAAGLAVRGFVLSQPAPAGDPSAATNAATVQELTGLPVIAVLRHLPDAGAAADAFDAGALRALGIARPDAGT
jgi:dethiobiotin synthetase